MSEAQQNVRVFVLIAFLLLAALFGMIIMTFIFGNIQTGITTSFTAFGTTTVNNETGGFVNASVIHTLDSVTNDTFRGSVTVSTVYTNGLESNLTGGLVDSGNYTVDAASGTITGLATNTQNFTDVNITYTYSLKREAQVVSENVQNNSLVAIRTYSSQANTQFTTVAIAITLAVLIAVFLLFWKAFMGGSLGGGGKGKGRSSDKNSGMDV